MDDQIISALRVLELKAGASLDEIKKAYRELVKVWHPDRFPSDEALRLRGLEKIKEINSAYELLTSIGSAASSSEGVKRSSVSVIRVDEFAFYGSCFDEIENNETRSKAPSACRLVTPQFFNTIADWVRRERAIKMEMVQKLEIQSGYCCVSHADFRQRTILLNISEQPVAMALIKPIIRFFIRDKLVGVTSDKKTFEGFSRALRDSGWNGDGCLTGESYFRAESALTRTGSDDLLNRLLDEGGAGYWADTKMLYKLSYAKGPHSVEDWGRMVGMNCKNNPPYR